MSTLKKIAAMISRARDAAHSIRESAAALRADVRAAQVRRMEIEAAPIAMAEVERRVDAALDDAEASFLAGGWASEWLSAPNFGCLGEKLEFIFQRQPLGGFSHFGGREILKAALLAEAAAGMPVDAKPLTSAEREKALAAADAEIERLERAEEVIIREADSAGVTIPRREDARAEIFLAPDEDVTQ